MSLRTPCAWAECPREGCGLGTGRHPLERKQWWFRCRVGERLSCKPQLFLQTRFTSYIKAEFWHFFPKAVKREEMISKKLNRLTQQVFNLMATFTRAPADSSKIKTSSKEQNLLRSSPKLNSMRVNFRHQVLAEGRLCTFTLFCAVWPGDDAFNTRKCEAPYSTSKNSIMHLQVVFSLHCSVRAHKLGENLKLHSRPQIPHVTSEQTHPCYRR